MKHWLILWILFFACSSPSELQAQYIDINTQNIQARLLIQCYIGTDEVPIDGRSLRFNSKQINTDATLKVTLLSLNSERITSVMVHCKQAKTTRNLTVNAPERFYPNINPGGGTWTLTVSALSSTLKDHILEYSIRGGKPTLEEKIEAPITVIDSGEIEWQRAKLLNTIPAYERFLKKYPKLYRAEANKRILQLTPLKAVYTQSKDNLFLVKVSPVLGTAPTAKLLGDSSKTFSFKKINPNDRGFQTEFFLEDSKKYSLEIRDPGRSSNEQLYTLVLDNTFRFHSLDRTEMPQTIQLIGGKAPYQAQFYSKDNLIKTLPIDNPWTISETELKKYLEPGTYTLKLRDAHLIDSVNLDFESPIIIPATVAYDWRQWIPYALGALAFLFIILLVAALNKRKAKQRIAAAKAQMQQKIAENEVDPPLPNEPLEIIHKTPVIIPIPNILQESQAEPDEFVTPEPTRKGIIIRAKASEDAEMLEQSEYFKNLLQSGQYQMIPLSQIWRDSAISHLYFSPESIRSLDDFLQKENLDLVQTKGANIPEIGGMLLGRCALDQQGSYAVGVEKFVPIKARFHNVYQLAFDPLSIAEEVSKVTDEFPELRIMGWFHTHPGHGLFLSNQDLEIQAHYRELYHFAMEIDSLSPELSTGFFTRTPNGQINNHQDLIPGASWFSWNLIRNRHA